MLVAGMATLVTGSATGQSHDVVVLEGVTEIPGAGVLTGITSYGLARRGTIVVRAEIASEDDQVIIGFDNGAPQFSVRLEDLVDYLPEETAPGRGAGYHLGAFGRSDGSNGGQNSFRFTPQGRMVITATEWTPRGRPTNQGVFVREPDGGLTPILRTDRVISQDETPSEIEFFKYAITDPWGHDREGVVFGAWSEVNRFGPTGVEKEDVQSVMRVISGSVEKLLVSGKTIPGFSSDFVLGDIDEVEVSEDGQVLVIGNYGPEAQDHLYEGVWMGASDGGFRPLLTNHDKGVSFARGLSVSRVGYAAARCRGGEGGDEIWIGGPSGQAPVVQNGTRLGEGSQVFTGSSRYLPNGELLLVNGRGDLVFFAATLRLDGELDMAFWFRDASGSFARALGSGDPLVDIPFAQVTSSSSGSPVTLIDFNDHGQALLKVEYQTLLQESGVAFVVVQAGSPARVVYSTSGVIDDYPVTSLLSRRGEPKEEGPVFLDEGGYVLTLSRLEIEGGWRRDALVFSGPFLPADHPQDPGSPLAMDIRQLPGGGIALSWNGGAAGEFVVEVSTDLKTWLPLIAPLAQSEVIIDNAAAKFGSRAFFRVGEK